METRKQICGCKHWSFSANHQIREIRITCNILFRFWISFKICKICHHFWSSISCPKTKTFLSVSSRNSSWTSWKKTENRSFRKKLKCKPKLSMHKLRDKSTKNWRLQLNCLLFLMNKSVQFVTMISVFLLAISCADAVSMMDVWIMIRKPSRKNATIAQKTLSKLLIPSKLMKPRWTIRRNSLTKWTPYQISLM